MRTNLTITVLIQAVWSTTVDFSIYMKETERLDLNNRNIIYVKNIAALSNLMILDLSDNGLKELTPEIGELTKLTMLVLTNNKLAKLPSEIGNLKELTELCVDKNGLEELPQEIGQLKNLKTIDAHNNQLRTIPEKILDLPNLTMIYLDGNNLDKFSYSREAVGEVDLKAALEKSVFLDEVEMPKQTDIPKRDAYIEPRSDPVCWNFSQLKKLKPLSIPPSKHTEESIIKKWNEIYMKWKAPRNIKEIIGRNKEVLKVVYQESVQELFEMDVDEEADNTGIEAFLELLVRNRDQDIMKLNVSKLDEQNKEKFMTMWKEIENGFIMSSRGRAMEDLIHHIYDTKRKPSEWSMPEKYIRKARNLLGNILDELSKKKDVAFVVQSINMICDKQKHSSYKLMLEMDLVHQILMEKGLKYNLRILIMAVIKNEKKRVFRSMKASLPSFDKDYDVLIGIMSEELRLERMDQAQLRDWIRASAMAFYSLFTPEHIFKMLKEYINADSKMVAEALEIINVSKKISAKDKVKMCQYEGSDTVDSSDDKQFQDIVGKSEGITEEFATIS